VYDLTIFYVIIRIYMLKTCGRFIYGCESVRGRHPYSGQNQNIRIANESFGTVATFRYLETILTNQNDIHDEIKSRLNSGNACFYSDQNLLSSRLI
jgi:hypothetical protein